MYSRGARRELKVSVDYSHSDRLPMREIAAAACCHLSPLADETLAIRHFFVRRQSEKRHEPRCSAPLFPDGIGRIMACIATTPSRCPELQKIPTRSLLHFPVVGIDLNGRHRERPACTLLLLLKKYSESFSLIPGCKNGAILPGDNQSELISWRIG